MMTTWNHKIVYKLFVLDRNTWYPLTVYKNPKETTLQKKITMWTYNWCSSLPSRHKITLDGLTRHLNKSIWNIKNQENTNFYIGYIQLSYWRIDLLKISGR